MSAANEADLIATRPSPQATPAGNVRPSPQIWDREYIWAIPFPHRIASCVVGKFRPCGRGGEVIASGCGFGYDGDEKDVVFRRRWFLDSLTIGQSCELDKMQTSQDMQQPGGLSEYRRGFTLIELLVVVAIIALLVSILVPSLGEAMRQAELTTCQTRVKAQLQALHMYATSEDGLLPCGPDFPLFPGGPATNSVGTNNIWIGPAQTYNAHGVLLEASLVVDTS